MFNVGNGHGVDGPLRVDVWQCLQHFSVYRSDAVVEYLFDYMTMINTKGFAITSVRNMQDMFYLFVKEGKLPHGDSNAKSGVYTVDKSVVTHRSYQNCDFWLGLGNIVPNFGKMN